jgi:phage tail sheath protein FI
MSNYLTPGVYIEEVRALSLSLSSSDTAVPVFSATNGDFTALEGGADVDHFEIRSWLDVTNRVKGFKQIEKRALAAALKEAGTSGSTVMAAAKAGGAVYHAAVSALHPDNGSLAAAKLAGDAATEKVEKDAGALSEASDAADDAGVLITDEPVEAIESTDADVAHDEPVSTDADAAHDEPVATAADTMDDASVAIDAPALKTKQTQALLQRFIDAYNAAVTIDPLAALGTMLARSLNAYFSNGGGRAYVCKMDSLPSVVPLLSEATLLVEAGTALPAVTINGICKSGSGVFGLLDAKNVLFSGSNHAALLPNATGEHVAIYYPWLKEGVADIPPSAVMAGVYAKVDAERGVWQAPANIAVQGGQVAAYMSDAHQGALNDHASPINVIRKVRNEAAKVWGARTGAKDSAFRYIQVRRLFDALERDIRRTMKRAVFEPNTSATWETVRSAIDHYLHETWRQGGLVGTKPEDAYRVAIGKDVTMTNAEIDAGTMIAEVAVAPIRPAEFVIIRFSEKR